MNIAEAKKTNVTCPSPFKSGFIPVKIRPAHKILLEGMKASLNKKRKEAGTHGKLTTSHCVDLVVTMGLVAMLKETGWDGDAAGAEFQAIEERAIAAADLNKTPIKHKRNWNMDVILSELDSILEASGIYEENKQDAE